MKRVTRELRDLQKSLPMEYASSVFLRYDKTRPYIMHVRRCCAAAGARRALAWSA